MATFAPVSVTLFQAQAPSPAQQDNASNTPSVDLSNASPVTTPQNATKIDVTAQSMQDNIKDGASRLAKLGTTLLDNLKSNPAGTLKSLAKQIRLGAGVGAFVGTCTAGVKGFFLGGFLGGLLSSALGTKKAYKNVLKQELLQVAGNSIDPSKAQTGMSAKDTTLHFTNGKSKINLSKMGATLKGADAKVATVMLNANNNQGGVADDKKLSKLNLSGNNQVNPEFIANLLLAARPAAQEDSPLPFKHGLEGITVKLKDTAVTDKNALVATLEKSLPGDDKGVSLTPTETKDVFDLNVTSESLNVKLKIKTDAGFNPAPAPPPRTSTSGAAVAPS